MQTGVISWGVYIPRLRIKQEEYQKVWGYFSPRGVEEKTVADFDEDSITMSVEAASNALKRAEMAPSGIDAVYFASTSAPYTEKQNASTIATALGCRTDNTSLDVASSVSSGISALLSCVDFVGSGRGRVGLTVAADCPHADPAESIEHQLGAGAAALIVGSERLGAIVEGTFSCVTESLGERFRRDGASFVATTDLGRFHEIAYDAAVTSCVKGLLGKLGRSAKDYESVVLQGPDDVRALDVSKKLGFEDRQMTAGMISKSIGDTGVAGPLLGLCKILESARPKQHVMVCSYGPGSGADAVSVVVEREMHPAQGRGYEDYVGRKEYLDYANYLKLRRTIGRG